MNDPSLLAFERLYARLGLPFWLGTIVAFLPFLALIYASSFVVPSARELLPFIPFFLAQVIFIQFAARHARSRIQSLMDHASSMGIKDSHQLDALYRAKGQMVTWIIAALVFLPPFTLANAQSGTAPAGTSTILLLIFGLGPWVYYALLISFFLWAWSYSMYKIYRIAKLPLQLKPFSEDPMLGLRPFSAVSMRLTILFIVFIAIFTVQIPAQGLSILPFLALYAGLFSLGVTLFILPLRNLRAKLVETKKEELSWANRRFTDLINKIKSKGDAPLEEKVAIELTAVTSIQHEVRQIKSWPFDTALLARLLAVMITITAITMARIFSSVLMG